MIEAKAFYKKEVADILSLDHHRSNELDVQRQEMYYVPGRSHMLRQMLRFGLVGGLNTLVVVLC